MNDEREAEWDWVTARAKCSALEMFEVLHSAAKANIKARNALNQPPASDSQFVLTDEIDEVSNRRTLTVFDTTRRPDRRFAKFVLDPNGIHIHPHKEAEFDVAITLNNDGLCRFRVLGEDLEAWRLMRRALESLLF